MSNILKGIRVGDRVELRNGRVYRITRLAPVDSDPYPIIGRSEDTPHVSESWRADGTYGALSTLDLDIVRVMPQETTTTKLGVRTLSARKSVYDDLRSLVAGEYIGESMRAQPSGLDDLAELWDMLDAVTEDQFGKRALSFTLPQLQRLRALCVRRSAEMVQSAAEAPHADAADRLLDMALRFDDLYAQLGSILQLDKQKEATG